MNLVKKFCIKHHFYYSGTSCPFCENDRINELSKKYKVHKKESDMCSKKKTKEVNRELTIDDLNKLKEKFNSK